MEKCPLCQQSTLQPSTRLIKDSCGHIKCRMCLLKEENGCYICNNNKPENLNSIQEINHSLPVKLPDNINNSLHKIILSISSSNNSFSDVFDKEMLTISELDDEIPVENINVDNTNINGFQTVDQTISSKVEDRTKTININCQALTIVENISTKNAVAVENESTNCNQIARLPNHQSNCRSPEFSMSDYLLFKNPYNHYYNQCKSPEFRLSDYLVMKSPNRLPDINPISQSPVQYLNNKSQNFSRSDCLIFSKKSPIHENVVTDQCQTEKTICYVLNNNGELHELNNFIVKEFTDISSDNNKHYVIDYVMQKNAENCLIAEKTNETNSIEIIVNNNTVNEPYIIQEFDEDKENNEQIKNYDESSVISNLRDNNNLDTLKRNKNIINKQKKLHKSRNNNVSNESPKTKIRKRRPKNQDWSHIVELESGKLKQFKCTICQKRFKYLRGKFDHSRCKIGTAPYICKFEGCNRIFSKRSHFEYHERVHTGEKPYECDNCKKRFIQKNKLIRHLASVHNKIEYECNECKKIFKSKEYLKIHVLVHEEKTFECRFCKKIFKLERNRHRHELCHTSDKPFKCGDCSANFQTSFLLKRHKKIHENNRPFSCVHCKQLFLSKYEVERHAVRHFDEKLYACKKCNKSFSRKDNLKRHLKHQHLENDFSKFTVTKKSSLPSSFLKSDETSKIPVVPRLRFNPKIISKNNSFYKSFEKEKNNKEQSREVSNIGTRSDSNEGVVSLNINERLKTGQTNKEIITEAQASQTEVTKNNIHTHWRRRITESLKFQNQKE